ncbi:MAG: hypothetical protein AAAB13_20625 [Pseudomonas sp.]
MHKDIDIDELYKGRGFVRDFSRCGWVRGEDFVSDRVIHALDCSPHGRETLRLIAKNEENNSSEYPKAPA